MEVGAMTNAAAVFWLVKLLQSTQSYNAVTTWWEMKGRYLKPECDKYICVISRKSKSTRFSKIIVANIWKRSVQASFHITKHLSSQLALAAVKSPPSISASFAGEFSRHILVITLILWSLIPSNSFSLSLCVTLFPPAFPRVEEQQTRTGWVVLPQLLHLQQEGQLPEARQREPGPERLGGGGGRSAGGRGRGEEQGWGENEG